GVTEGQEEGELPGRGAAEVAWVLSGLALLGGLLTYVAAQGHAHVIVRDLPGDVLWLSLGGGIGLPAIIFGILALASRQVRAGEIRGRFQALAAIGCGLVGLLFAWGSVLAGQGHLAFDARMMTHHRLRQVASATYDYADNHNNSLPPAEAFRTKDGKPGLSWRVALLPYLEQEDL